MPEVFIHQDTFVRVVFNVHAKVLTVWELFFEPLRQLEERLRHSLDKE